MAQPYAKDPQAKLDYYLDWGPWLEGDTIVTSTWSTASSVTLSDTAILGGLTRVWVAGGTVGEAVALVNHIVTTGGREDDRSLYLIIQDQ